MHKLRLVIGLGVSTCLFVSCQSIDNGADSEEVVSSRTKSVEKTTPYSDLKMFELSGPVKECVSETFFNCDYKDNKIYADTNDLSRRSIQVAFDREGRYVVAKNELIQRDEKGRMTYWRDSRPNDAKMHPGVLRDTLAYTHLNDNVLESSGMDEYAVTVYDNQGRVAGMYSQNATVANAVMSAFNVYRKEDRQGNWTERLTVWTSRGANGKPHVSYSLTRRSITYYEED